MKNFFKALGFTLLIGLTYIVANFGMTIVFMVIIAAFNMDQFAGLGGMQNPEQLTIALTELLSPYLLHITIISNIATLGLMMLYFLGRKDSFKTYVRFRKVKKSDLLLVLGFGFFLNLLFSPIIGYAMELLPQTMVDHYAELMEVILGGSIILTVITTSIVAPLFEEIVVRGVIYNDFKKALPVWAAIIIQALVFGLLHMNWIQSTYAFAIGIVFGIVYERYKSIWMPIGIHFVFNTTSIALSPVFELIEGTLIGDISLLFVGAVGCAGMVYLLNKGYESEYYMEESTLNGIGELLVEEE